ncbi:MAG: transglycosylase domain-containing protein [Thiobacillaceae bacterium]
MHRFPRRLLISLGMLLLILLAVIGVLVWELMSSDIQAKYFAKTARKMTFEVKEGPSDRIRFPQAGPYDLRMGYSQIPAFTARLSGAGWQIGKQAKISIQMARVEDLGINPPYREKNQGGLTLLDSEDKPLFQSRYPQRIYSRFEDVPPVLANSLLFIENRELLNDRFPSKNPAVEWDRLGEAVLEKAYSLANPAHNVPGGSTLPTQIEKYRHSPDGVTLSMLDKLKQMGSASLRAYLDGENTLSTRKRIVRDYLNTVPLAAAPRYGEVNGLGDGVWAWYGLNFDSVNQALSEANKAPGHETAVALKHALSLLVSERKPSYYLVKNRTLLDSYTNVHLDLLADAGIISNALRDKAKRVKLRPWSERKDPPKPPFAAQKVQSALRTRLAGLLGLDRLYDLDRLDLTAQSTLNGPAQQVVSDYLIGLADPAKVAEEGLLGKRLLKPDNDFKKIIYSFNLYEKAPQGNLLRIQADNLNQPFDINQQTKLDLGSTAKFRTLVSYLEIIAQLRKAFVGMTPEQLRAQTQPRRDVLAQWVAEYLLGPQDKSLAAMLDAAMARRYSAAPEPFYTGGGVHNFSNFDKDDNGRILDLWHATQNSVNLVFIRLMRDVARHYMEQSPGAVARVLDDASNPARRTYLLRFVDQEGKIFLHRFYQRHQNQTLAEMTEELYARAGPSERRFSAIFRYLEPQSGLDVYGQVLEARFPRSPLLKPSRLESMFSTLDPAILNLSDRGYVTQIHPLELWLVKYLREHPNASFDEVVAASSNERVEVYDWLFKTSRKNAQDIRIQSLMEVEAFEALLKDWKRLGYPFDSLTPSYATVIGSSGDRPAALAELMGIIANDGVRLPMVSLTHLSFAADTPYATEFVRQPPQGERLFPAEIAQVIRKALRGVVEGGTAVRLAGALKDSNGQPIVIGGKTGTGDHRFEHFGQHGQVIESRVVDRTATFVFYLGDRYFGTITALVPGPEAARYEFTSAMTAQILRRLLPRLQPLLFKGATTEAAAPVLPPKPEILGPVKVPPIPPAAARPAAKKAAEAKEGTAREAEPKVPADNGTEGFPQDLDPVLPSQPAPSPRPAAPAGAVPVK